MNRILLINLCLLVFMLSTIPGHTQKSHVSPSQGQQAWMTKGGKEVAAEDLPDIWARLLREQPPRSPGDMSTAALNHILQGKYIFSATGGRFDFILGMTNVQSAIGEFNFDGQGGFTGLQVSRTLFTNSGSFRFAGRYTVDASGGGFLFFPNETESIVVVNSGEGFFFTDLDSANFREAGYARHF